MIQKDLDMLNKHIFSLKKSILDYLKYDQIFEQRKNDLEKAKENENLYAIKKAETNKEVQFCEFQIKEKQIEINKKEEEKKKTEKIKEAEFWISGKFLNLILFTED